MSTNTLLFEVNGNKIKRVGGFEPTSGEKNYTTMRFTLDESWKGVQMVSVLQFFDPSDIPEPLTVEVKNLTAVCPINPELRHQSGVLTVGLLGVKADGSDVTIDTFPAVVPVGQGFRVNDMTTTQLYVRLLEYLARLNSLLITEENPVISELLGEGAVLERHIAEGAITTSKILKGAVTPEKLDRDYVRLGALSVSGDNFHSFLKTYTNESREPDKKMFILQSNGDGALGTVGKGRCIGFYSSSTEFRIHNLTTAKAYKVSFSEEKIKSVDLVKIEDIADGAVTTEKIAENAVTPNELDRLYVEYLGIPSIRSFAELDEYITSAEDLDNYKTLYRFGFDQSFPKHAQLGDSVYIGFIADYYENETPKLMLINTETFETWSYVAHSAQFNKVSLEKELKTINRTPIQGEGNISIKHKNILCSGLEGKAVSFLGDSITTFEGWIPSDYGVYYNKEKQEASGITDVERTWWRQLLNATGMKLCVNASWTGSSVSSSRTTNSSGVSNDETYAKMGCSTKRIADLTAGGGRPSDVADGTKPDIIVVMIGINDFGDDVPVGSWTGEALPSEGVFNTFSEAYALMVSKIMTTYPDSELFLCTLPETPGKNKWDDTAGFPVNQEYGVALKAYNDRIRLIAEVFGCNIIDMHACGINYFNGSKYLYDRLHPNYLGANLMARKAIADITAHSVYNYEPDVSELNMTVLKDIKVTYTPDQLETTCLLYSSSEEFEQGTCGLPTGSGYDQWRVLTCDIPKGAKSITVKGASVYNGAGARFNLIAPIALYNSEGKLLSIYDVAAVDYHQVSYALDVLEYPIPESATIAKICWRLGALADLDTNKSVTITETSPVITWQVDNTYNGTYKKDDVPEAVKSETWYVDVAKYSTMSATAKPSSASYSYCHPDTVAACVGVPINAIRIAVSTAGVMTYGKVSSAGFVTLGTINLVNPSTTLQIYRINEVVLSEGERLWFNLSTDTGKIYYGSDERRTPKARFNTKVSSDNLAPASYSVANLSIDIGYIES